MVRTLRTQYRGTGEQGHVIFCVELAKIDFDLEAGYEYLLDNYDFIDKERTVALGASYGGYMVELSY